MKIKVNKNPRFTVGISYKEHLTLVNQTFDQVVKPQLEDKSATSIKSPVESTVLTPAQKAYLNCLNPI